MIADLFQNLERPVQQAAELGIRQRRDSRVLSMNAPLPCGATSGAPAFWWMHAVVCVLLLSTLILVVAEPFIPQRHFRRWTTARPDIDFAWLRRAHWLLLVLSVVTILGTVVGSHGGWTL